MTWKRLCLIALLLWCGAMAATALTPEEEEIQQGRKQKRNSYDYISLKNATREPSPQNISIQKAPSGPFAPQTNVQPQDRPDEPNQQIYTTIKSKSDGKAITIQYRKGTRTNSLSEERIFKRNSNPASPKGHDTNSSAPSPTKSPCSDPTNPSCR